MTNKVNHLTLPKFEKECCGKITNRPNFKNIKS